MCDARIITCDACDGDGHFEWCDGHVGGEPHYASRRCTQCGGTGEEEIELSPIDMEDLDALC